MNEDEYNKYFPSQQQVKQATQTQPTTTIDPQASYDQNTYNQYFPQTKTNTDPRGPSTMMDMVDVFNNEVNKLGNGILQMGSGLADAVGISAGKLTSQLKQERTRMQRDADAAMMRSPIAGTAAQVAGQAANSVYTGALTGGSLINPTNSATSNILNAGSLNAISQGAQAGTPAERAQNAVVGGVGGMLGQGLGEGAGLISSQLPKVLNSDSSLATVLKGLGAGTIASYAGFDPVIGTALGAALGNSAKPTAASAVGNTVAGEGTKAVTDTIRNTAIVNYLKNHPEITNTLGITGQ